MLDISPYNGHKSKIQIVITSIQHWLEVLVIRIRQEIKILYKDQKGKNKIILNSQMI